MKLLFLLVYSLSFSLGLLADAPPVTLDGKEHYELGLHLDILEDPSGELTINDVNRPEWKGKFKRSKKNIPNFGFSKSAFWVRLRIINRTDQRIWFLSQNYSTQGYIALFKKVEGKWERSSTGNLTPFETKEIEDKTYSFKIKPKINDLYFLRIKGTINKLDLSLSSPKNFAQIRSWDNLLSGLFFGLVISMIIFNLLIFLSTKSLSSLYYSIYVLFFGLFLFMAQGFSQRFLVPDSIWISNDGLIFFTGLAGIFLIHFAISFLKIYEVMPRPYRMGQILILTSFLVTLSSFILPLSFSTKFVALNTLLILPYLLTCGALRAKTGYRPAKYFFSAFSVMILAGIIFILREIGILPSNTITNQAVFVVIGLKLILLSLGLIERSNYQQEQTLKKELELLKVQDEEDLEVSKILNKKVQDLNVKLENKVAIQSKEINELMDSMKTSVFAVDKDFKVIPPVSKYSETIFGDDIVGKKVSEFLFSNIRKGTKEYRDLRTVFSIVFGADELQFFGLEDNLPKKVTFHDQINNLKKMLKLSYSGLYGQNDLLEKLICTAEDVTESEEHLKKAEEDQENYKFISEILKVYDKEGLARKMEEAIETFFKILEDFVSPLSDTYTLDHFHKILDHAIYGLQTNFKGLNFLEWKIHSSYIELEKFDKKDSQINPQIEAASTTCDILETLFRCSSSINYFVPINLNFNLSVTYIILEKIEDTEKIFKNLFEYVFLVREVDKIDEEKLKKVVQVAKLFPEFERTIDLIQQRSRLLSFLLKGVGEEELSSTYQNLSSKVKLMPERARLTEFIIENNLIEPYKEVLAKTKDIEEDLIERVEERQKEFLNNKGYLLLLTELINRFVRESKEGPDPSLPSLPEVEDKKINYFKMFVIVVEQGFEDTKNEKEFIKKNTFEIENIIGDLFLEKLTQKKALPMNKNNMKFIKFLKGYLLKKGD